MYRIATVVGARPQFVKAAVLSRELKKSGMFEEVLIHTGQHYDLNMSQVFFDEMDIPMPNYQLQVSNLDHGAMTGRMMEEIETIIKEIKPQAVLVYGDTNSTLAGALVAVKLHIPVIHVEAGLRSFNLEMPEEINRILTDRISKLLLCSTQKGIDNLRTEGFESMGKSVVLAGDIMEDSARYYLEKSKTVSRILEELNLDLDKFVLLTCHRAENTNHPGRMNSIIEGINLVAEMNKVVWPVHPRTKELIKKYSLHSNILLIEPVGYFDMLQLIENAKMILTDSGGLQKEAYFFNKFCVTLRDQTEWVELIENGFNKIVGADTQAIVEAYNAFAEQPFIKHIQLYGEGMAGKNMVRAIVAMFEK